jgi:hypothetical protein
VPLERRTREAGITQSWTELHCCAPRQSPPLSAAIDQANDEEESQEIWASGKRSAQGKTRKNTSRRSRQFHKWPLKRSYHGAKWEEACLSCPLRSSITAGFGTLSGGRSSSSQRAAGVSAVSFGTEHRRSADEGRDLKWLLPTPLPVPFFSSPRAVV